MFNKSTLFNLKENQEVRLSGLTFIRVVKVGQPTLKATIDAQTLKGDERCIFNHNTEEWERIDDLSNIVIGMGDKILVGNIMVMLTSLSIKWGTIRLSLRSSDPATDKSIKNAVGK